MKVVHISFAHMRDQPDPEAWLSKLGFYTGILNSMAEQGVVVKSIHCISRSAVLTKHGVDYHFLDVTPWQIRMPLTIARYVAKLNSDVVVVHGLIFPFQVIVLRWILDPKIKIVVQHHAEKPYKDARKYLQRIADRFISAYFFASTGLATAWLKDRQIANQSKIHEIMEASSDITPIPMTVAIQKTGIKGNPVYLWVGRLDENKDPITLVKAFIPFAALHPGATLYVIYQSTEQEEDLKQLASRSANIHLVGKVVHSELSAWYCSADFIISTSHYEGSGIAVCEAMSCGCIPILSDIHSFRAMTGNGKVGLRFEAGNAEALTDALKKSISLNCSAEKEKVNTQFKRFLSFDAIAGEMIHVIHKMI